MDLTPNHPTSSAGLVNPVPVCPVPVCPEQGTALVVRSSSALLLLLAATFVATGYGATFLLTSYFRAHGGNELDTGRTLGAAMVGTFVGVPLVGWCSGRVDAARLAAGGAVALGAGYLLLAVSTRVDDLSGLVAGFVIGLGWGMFYLGAPMALSERVNDASRGYWFTRFGAFQMVGIGGGPALIGLVRSTTRVSIETMFLAVALAALLASVLLFRFAAVSPRPSRDTSLRPWLRSLATLVRGASLRPLVMVALGACVFSGLLTFQSSLVVGSGARVGTYFAVYSVTVVVGRWAAARKLAAAPQVPLAVGLLAVMVLGAGAMFGVGESPAFQVLSAALTGIGYGLVYPVLQTWAVNQAQPHHRHAVLTWFVVFYFVGVFGFPVFGSAILVHAGKTVFLVALVCAGLVELAVALTAVRAERGTRSSSLTSITEEA